jgi:HAD superfamily hydrolase (TIGR01549 family)
MHNIKGIIFDLDGTLYQMRWYMRPLLACKLVPHLVRLPRFLKERGRFAGIQMGSRENLLNSIALAVSKKEKCSPEEIHNWILNSFYPAFISIMPFLKNSRSGIDEILISLRKNGLKLGVLSDYDHVSKRLERLQINPSLFDITTSSEASGALKPCSQPFLDIADQWNIPPEKILVIGDRDDTDGQAARNAGMPFIQITDSSQKSEALRWNELKSRFLSI